MATIATQQAALTGTALSFGAAASGDKVQADGKTMLIVNNGSGSSINVTITVPGSRFGQNYSPIVVAVPAGAIKVIGLLPKELRGTDKLVSIAWSSTTSVTRTVVHV